MEPNLVETHQSFNKSEYSPTGDYFYIVYLGEQQYKYGKTSRVFHKMKDLYRLHKYKGIVLLLLCDNNKQTKQMEILFTDHIKEYKMIEKQRFLVTDITSHLVKTHELYNDIQYENEKAIRSKNRYTQEQENELKYNTIRARQGLPKLQPIEYYQPAYESDEAYIRRITQ